MVHRFVRGAQVTRQAILSATYRVAQIAHAGCDGPFVRPAFGGMRPQPV